MSSWGHSESQLQSTNDLPWGQTFSECGANTDSEWNTESLFADSQSEKEKFVGKEGKYQLFSMEEKKTRLRLEKIRDREHENMMSCGTKHVKEKLRIKKKRREKIELSRKNGPTKMRRNIWSGLRRKEERQQSWSCSIG